ncbi:hypothetical protein Pcinc_008012 [Petrolisthes cinctipes]|uniref:Uncharacterized protein n=1 Tax=Petrolisthes cinctipes TaxID=88211 RepID=A0AAE1G9P5_PETCI|nr:hypothetical protein Pcinc_008012 [Petrolisthes cinctipes]
MYTHTPPQGCLSHAVFSLYNSFGTWTCTIPRALRYVLRFLKLLLRRSTPHTNATTQRHSQHSSYHYELAETQCLAYRINIDSVTLVLILVLKFSVTMRRYHCHLLLQTSPAPRLST